MTGTEPHSGSMSAIDAAVSFVAAQHGGPDRILTIHRIGKRGECVGCLTRPTPWPCVIAAVAEAARTA